MKSGDPDFGAYLPTEEEIRLELERLRPRKEMQLKLMRGLSGDPKSHGRVLSVHHRQGCVAVWREE